MRPPFLLEACHRFLVPTKHLDYMSTLHDQAASDNIHVVRVVMLSSEPKS